MPDHWTSKAIKHNSAPATLMGTTPEERALRDAEAQERQKEEQEWWLGRLGCIAERYAFREMREFLYEAWRRVSADGVDFQDERDRVFLELVVTFEELEKELWLAYQKLKAGETWKNRHFRNAQQLDEKFLYLILPQLRQLFSQVARTQKNNRIKREERTGKSYLDCTAKVAEIEKKHPEWNRAGAVSDTAAELGTSVTTVWRDLRKSKSNGHLKKPK